VDGLEIEWTGSLARGLATTLVDGNHHLAKVRVAGSNPVFRSIVTGQSSLFQPRLT
jgi:hypothetical protein